MKEELLGDQNDNWFKGLVGLNVDPEGLKTWHDFGDPNQVIFGYPERAGTYSLIFPTQVDSAISENMKVFLFLEVSDGKIASLTYSVIDVGFDGEGEHMQLPAFEPDIAVIENLLFRVVVPPDHGRLQNAVDDRLREMDIEDLSKAKDFFTQVYNDKYQQEKYGKILAERTKSKKSGAP